MKKQALTLLMISALIFSSACGDDTSSSAAKDEAGIDLQAALLTPGNTVDLSAADGSNVSAVTVDSNADDSADGLDIDGDGSRDVLYVTGSLGKTSGRAVTSIAFQLVGSETVFYFRASGSRIVMSASEDGEGVEVTLVTSSDTEGNVIVLGLNKSGGTEVEEEFAIPVYTNPDIPRLLYTTPVNHGTIGYYSDIVLVFSTSLHTTDFSYGGSLANLSDIVFSTTNTANDTVTVSPQEGWSDGAQTLTFNAKTSASAVIAQVNLDYTVDVVQRLAGEETPADGASIQSGTDVISIVFDRSLDTSQTVVNATTYGAHTVSFATTHVANDTVVMTPTTTWDPSLCSAQLEIIAYDIGGTYDYFYLYYGGFC